MSDTLIANSLHAYKPYAALPMGIIVDGVVEYASALQHISDVKTLCKNTCFSMATDSITVVVDK
jgi:hypothetical protein